MAISMFIVVGAAPAANRRLETAFAPAGAPARVQPSSCRVDNVSGLNSCLIGRIEAPNDAFRDVRCPAGAGAAMDRRIKEVSA